MIKTIIKDDADLFTEETATVFTNKEGTRTQEVQKLKVANLANSLTWKYAISPIGRVSFYRIDRAGNYHDESEVVEGCGGKEHIYANDYIWFKSEGKFSTWGKMIPPRNPARRALWEKSHFLPRQACRFELTPEQYSEIISRWERDSARHNHNMAVAEIKIKHVYGGLFSSKPILSALIRRNLNHKWRIVELCGVEGISGDKLYSVAMKLCRMIDEMNRSEFNNNVAIVQRNMP